MRSRQLDYLLVNIPYRDLLLVLIAFGIGTIYTRLRNSSKPAVNCVSLKLKEAEANWQMNSEKIARSEQLIPSGKFPNQARFDWKETDVMIWDYFVPSFSCPFTTERLGRVGDGGKWVCRVRELALQSNCVVYSFGIRDDTSFEEDILSRTSCRVHMFDPTSSADQLPILNRFAGRATFLPLAIGSEKATKFQDGVNTLKGLMKMNGDTFADIVKMDVEGAEWEVIADILTSFPAQLPFAQLQVEFHLNSFDAELQYEGMRSVWRILHQAGLRPFHAEPNLIAGSRGVFLLQEFAFLNTNSIQSPFYVHP